MLLQPLQRLRVGSRFAGLLQCKHASVNFSYRNTAPGNIERLNNEEPSPLTAAEGQGAPSTLGSLKSVDMSCGHPFGDPGPLADHDMPQIPKSRGHRGKNKNSITKVVQAASPPDAISEKKETLDSGSKG